MNIRNTLLTAAAIAVFAAVPASAKMAAYSVPGANHQVTVNQLSADGNGAVAWRGQWFTFPNLNGLFRVTNCDFVKRTVTLQRTTWHQSSDGYTVPMTITYHLTQVDKSDVGNREAYTTDLVLPDDYTAELLVSVDGLAKKPACATTFSWK